VTSPKTCVVSDGRRQVRLADMSPTLIIRGEKDFTCVNMRRRAKLREALWQRDPGSRLGMGSRSAPAARAALDTVIH